MYKYVHGLNPTYLNDLFTAQSRDYHLRGLSNQNSTPLKLASNHAGILVQSFGMSCLLTLNDLRICQFSKEL